MRVLVIEPERRPEVREIDDSLKAMQEIVGGLIQPIYPFDEPVALVCNDEGKLMNLPANRGLRDENGQIYDITPELEHRKSGYVERKRRPYQGNVVRIA